jgi:hypothetical protein
MRVRTAVSVPLVDTVALPTLKYLEEHCAPVGATASSLTPRAHRLVGRARIATAQMALHVCTALACGAY